MESVCKKTGCGSGIYDLRVNDLIAPMGVDYRNLSFSWKMCSQETGAKQTAYCIIVSDESGKKLWNTGWVDSDESVGIAYSGAALENTEKYEVSVDEEAINAAKGINTSQI